MQGGRGPLVERRKYPRVRALHLVTYSAQSGSVQKIPASIGRTLDLSSSGTRLEVYQRIDPHCELEVEIAVGDTIFSTHGKYIHSSPIAEGIYTVGIEFDQLHPEIVALIDQATGDPLFAP
jgi:hypothetical protein